MPSAALPIANPAAAHINRTLKFRMVSASAARKARPGAMDVIAVIHLGECAERLRVNQRYRPSPIRPTPTAMRRYGAQPGCAFRLPTRSEATTKAAVIPAMETTHPARNARLVGRGRGVCSIRMAGMIVNGDSAMTIANGISSASSKASLLTTET